MIIAYFVVAGFVALAFVAAGGLKLVRPKPALVKAGLKWVDDFPLAAVKLIGLAEVLGAIGLIVPVATGIAPVLSPIAGICLLIVMLAAMIVHTRRREPIVVNIVLAALTLAAVVLGFIVV